METLPSSAEKQHLVSSFLEFAVGQTADTAVQFLQATGWKLEEAVQLFYVGGEAGEGNAAPSPLPSSSPVISDQPLEDEVRAPLPVIRDTLYGDPPYSRFQQPNQVVAFRNFEEESRRTTVWDSNENVASPANGSRDNLASLYSPPFALMYQGSFEQAKVEASLQSKWLLINVQSNEEFNSHMLNRDTWANDAVAQTIRTNFIFWQVYHDTSEGKKVCTYYSLFKLPAVLVIDPITGQKMHAWSGMINPERLLEDALPFLDKGPKEHHTFTPQKRARITEDKILEKEPLEEDDPEILQAIAHSLEENRGPSPPPAAGYESKPEKAEETSSSNGELKYPPLPEEPKGCKDLCRVSIRLPDGRRVPRNFLRTDSVKLLWSFCASKLEGDQKQPFHFTQAIPGASQKLEFSSESTFQEAGLSNSMITLIWD